MIITLYPNGTMGLREHRRRKEFVVPVGKVFRLAVDVTIEAERKAKAAERDRKRAERGLPPIRRLVKRGLL